jgi:hypothetical protein
MAKKIGTHFLVRTCVDRLAGDGDHTIPDEMDEVETKGLHRIEVRDNNGDLAEAVRELKYRRVHILPCWKAETLSCSDLDSDSCGGTWHTEGQKEIEWKLITDLTVQSLQDARKI